jgi:hypothetical protein
MLDIPAFFFVSAKEVERRLRGVCSMLGRLAKGLVGAELLAVAGCYGLFHGLNTSPSFRVRCSEWAPFLVSGECCWSCSKFVTSLLQHNVRLKTQGFTKLRTA